MDIVEKRKRNAGSQKKYKLSEKGKATQARYYVSEAKKKSSWRWRQKPGYRLKKVAHYAVEKAISQNKLSRKPCTI